MQSIIQVALTDPNTDRCAVRREAIAGLAQADTAFFQMVSLRAENPEDSGNSAEFHCAVRAAFPATEVEAMAFFSVCINYLLKSAENLLSESAFLSMLDQIGR